MTSSPSYDILGCVKTIKLLYKNQKKLDCGIVAVFNASQWCNIAQPYETIEKLAKSCGYNPKKGIFFFQFANLIKKLKLPAKRVKSKSIKEIESKLDSGKFFIFLYTSAESDTGHAIVTFTDHRGRIIIINPQKNGPKTWIGFAYKLVTEGAKNFIAYEIPRRTNK